MRCATPCSQANNILLVIISCTQTLMCSNHSVIFCRVWMQPNFAFKTIYYFQAFIHSLHSHNPFIHYYLIPPFIIHHFHSVLRHSSFSSERNWESKTWVRVRDSERDPHSNMMYVQDSRTLCWKQAAPIHLAWTHCVPCWLLSLFTHTQTHIHPHPHTVINSFIHQKCYFYLKN